MKVKKLVKVTAAYTTMVVAMMAVSVAMYAVSSLDPQWQRMRKLHRY